LQGSSSAASGSLSAPSTETASAAAGSGTAAAAVEASASPAAAFEIPGKQVQVLPIGLGVFAGVSVIALIVVGLVTYERTKYRRVCNAAEISRSL
jgi:hypothetical protein